MPLLPQLTQIEEMLIAQVQPIVSVFVVRGGQLSYRGNIINFPQDVHSFVNTLPRDPENLDVMIVRQPSHDSSTFRDYKVRRGHVEAWLRWLKAHNIFYAEINIDEDALDRLPEDGSVYHQLRHISDNRQHSAQTPIDEQADRLNDGDDNANIAENISQSFIPAPPPELPEIDAINNELERLENDNSPMEWPHVGDTPINEFKEPGYIARAFPTLYPWGKADFRDARRRAIKPAEYFQHLLKFVS